MLDRDWLDGLIDGLEMLRDAILDAPEPPKDPQTANYMSVNEVETKIRYKERSERLERLIKWLALPWKDNDPEFSAYDHFSQQDLPENAELEATWFEVVRGGVRPEKVMEMVRAVCDTCRGAQTMDDGRDCSVCCGRGYLEFERYVEKSE